MGTVNAVTPAVLEHAGVGADGDQLPDPTALVINVESMIVADRYRKDLGDVSDLVKSITEIGLLNPITVREWHGGYRLVAGERRLTAFKRMGLADIPARVARDIADARDALVAERDENTARKPMLPTEAAALGMAIEEMEKPAAMERMLAGKAPCATGGTGSEEGYRSREIAAEAVGLTRGTYQNIKTAITAADNEDEPEEVRAVARDVLVKIDAGEPIRPNVERIKEARRKGEPAAVAKPKRANDPVDYLLALAEMYATARLAFESEGHEKYASLNSFGEAARRADVSWRFTEKQWQARTETSRDVLDRSTLAISTALDAIDIRVDMTTITPEQATEVLERLDSTALNRIIRQLKEISNG